MYFDNWETSLIRFKIRLVTRFLTLTLPHHSLKKSTFYGTIFTHSIMAI